MKKFVLFAGIALLAACGEREETLREREPPAQRSRPGGNLGSRGLERL